MLTQYKLVHTTSHSLKMVSNTTSLQMVNLGLEYTYVGGADTVATTQAAPAAQSTDYSASYSNEASTQSVSSNQQSSNTNVEAASAPKTTSYSASTSSSSSASTGGSVKAQFLANGGTEAAWNAIVMPESGGNPNAVNPAGYRGLGQTKESWVLVQ